MKRFLIFLVLFGVAIAVLRWLAGALAAGWGSGQSRRDAAKAERSTQLVRDRVCNTFLPRDRALALTRSGQVHYFCSEDCRSLYLSGSSQEIGTA